MRSFENKNFAQHAEAPNAEPRPIQLVVTTTDGCMPGEYMHNCPVDVGALEISFFLSLYIDIFLLSAPPPPKQTNSISHSGKI